LDNGTLVGIGISYLLRRAPERAIATQGRRVPEPAVRLAAPTRRGT